ncbi:MAG: hypothetical protein EBS29_09195, partial [Chloroflexia bacterium]|nr:hypothetical protein [Chloroflexia bacterium]
MTSRPKIPVVRHYDQQHLSTIALPLGGIGTGTVALTVPPQPVTLRLTATDLEGVTRVATRALTIVNIAPSCVVLNNLEADHLNYYKDLAEIQRTVRASLDGNGRNPLIVCNVDCSGVAGATAGLSFISVSP